MGSKDRRKRRSALLKKDGNICFYCREVKSKDSLQMDHVIPRSKGGSNGMDNLVLCCRECNTLKADSFMSANEVQQKKRESEWKM